MRISKFLSNYLKSKDVKAPVVVTISGAEAVTFGEGKKDEKESLVVYFKELEQGVVLCKESIRQLVELTGSEDTDSWTGKRVELFNDPTVKFEGKNVGGIRFRAAK